MAHYLFHLGPDPLAETAFVVVALDSELKVVERRGDDLARLFDELRGAIGDAEWRVFRPLADALDLPPARVARPGEAQAVAMADRALRHADLGKYWQVADPVTRYAILQVFGLLARSHYFDRPGRGWPYRCHFEGTLTGEVFAVASSDETAMSLALVESEARVRQAFEAALDPEGTEPPDSYTLLLERRTPWWLDFTEALLGVAFEPVVLNVFGGKVHQFDDQIGITLAAAAAALAAADPGGEGSGRITVGAHDVRCRLTRFDP